MGKPTVLLGNFEVEREWGRGEIGLPAVAFAGSRAITTRMDELVLLLGDGADHAVLKAAPDPDFLAYLGQLGFPVPTVHSVAGGDPAGCASEDALAAPAVLAALDTVADAGGILSPHGVSAHEEALARRTGLTLAGPPAAVCKRVNSKVYSRRAADQAGLRQATGWACATLADLDRAVVGAQRLLAAGRTVVVKDAYGVSGAGLSVVADAQRLNQLARMVRSRAGRAGTDRIGLVVEEWVAKRTDLNYQFTIDPGGGCRFDFVLEALTEKGVHKGHRWPARLTAAQRDELEHTAVALGARLAADGYHGVVGVDSMIDPDGGLYPIVEINARRNMSTYLAPLRERFLGPDRVAVSRHFPLRLGRPVSFALLHDRLADLLPGGGPAQVVVTAHGTLNAGAAGDRPRDSTFDGRLYTLLVAQSTTALTTLDAEVTDRLAALAEETRD